MKLFDPELEFKTYKPSILGLETEQRARELKFSMQITQVFKLKKGREHEYDDLMKVIDRDLSKVFYRKLYKDIHQELISIESKVNVALDWGNPDVVPIRDDLRELINTIGEKI